MILILEKNAQAATCYYQSDHSKVEAIPLNALPKDQNLLTYLHIIPFNAERQAGKLRIQTFKSLLV